MEKDINDSTIGDVAYSTVRGAINMIPVIGPLAAELFNTVVTPPLDRRRAEWMNDIAERLKNLEESSALNLDDLANNEQFIDTIIQATNLAIRTSEEDKLNAFKNAVINTALHHSPDKTKSHIFLTQLNNFTTWHITILKYLDDPKEWFTINNMVPQNLMMGSISSHLLKAFDQLQGNLDLLNIIWQDLNSAGFINTSNFSTMMSGDGTLSRRTTEMGREFLNFITES
ncbi:hypothetical protein [Pedobacter agri]|uniref:Uncharacterized protein n=1 Tax=Pedobacter agri TaxID=454586 RepID=A0A9X3I871_9SPHI|nr:hypothetical protein [Pedobacter agri]MCX3264507.1 hypothetical protein [Pedobacter agri]